MMLLDEEKKKYDSVDIPDELSLRINAEIEKSGLKRAKKLIIRRRISRVSAAAAASIAVFTAALNTSTAFAETAGSIPVIGTVARVLTFRSYENENNGMNISVEIPSIDMISEDLSGIEQSVNREILELCENYADESLNRAEEYRTAFLSTGGTEEEWSAHDIRIKVWYEVKSQSDKYLSLAIMGTENWNSAHNETKYYNFDLDTGKLLELKDILGPDYKKTVDEEIKRQISERKESGSVYFEDLAGSNDSTDFYNDNTGFYINEKGNPVIVFAPYEIAPGSEGTQEFEIIPDTAESELFALTELLGMEDSESAELFGGGAENYSADGSFYIGRCYETSLCGSDCKIYTTCNDDKIIESVSVWLSSEDEPASNEDMSLWISRVSNFMGSEPSSHNISEESGSDNYTWASDGLIASVRNLDGLLTMSFQPAIGELK